MKADAAVRRILRGQLGRTRVEPLELSPGIWPLVRSRMFNGNVPGVLAAAVHVGALRLGDPERTSLFDQMMTRMVNDLRAEEESVRVISLLQSAGVDCVVLKGLAVAHLDYPNPSQRSTTDVDLLVRPTDIDCATSILLEAGYRRDLPERRPGFDRRFAKDVTFYGPRGVEIDMHRTLLRGPFGAAIDLDELWANQEALEIAGLPVRKALDRPSRLLHAAYTVAVADDRPSLANLCDVALLAKDEALDWDVVERRARRWRAIGVLADAVAVAAHTTGLDVRVPFAPGGYAAEDRWRRLYPSGGGSLVATTVGVVRAVEPGPALRYARDLAWPTSGYRHARREAGRRSELAAVIESLRKRYGHRAR